MDVSKIPAHARKAFMDLAARWHSPTVARLRFRVRDDDDKPVTHEAGALVQVSRSAMHGAREIFENAARIISDRTITPEAATVRSAQHARAKLDGLNGALLRGLEAAEERAKPLVERLNAALRPPADAGTAQVHAEARALIARTGGDKALALIRDDPMMQAAVATAPRALSGLSAEGFAAIRREHLQRVAPDAFAAHADLLRAVDDAGEAVRQAEGDAKAIIDFAAAAELQKLQVTQ